MPYRQPWKPPVQKVVKKVVSLAERVAHSRRTLLMIGSALALMVVIAVIRHRGLLNLPPRDHWAVA